MGLRGAKRVRIEPDSKNLNETHEAQRRALRKHTPAATQRNASEPMPSIIVEKLHVQFFRYELCVHLLINQTTYTIISLLIYFFSFPLSLLCSVKFYLNFLNIKKERWRLQPSSLSHLFWICQCFLSICIPLHQIPNHLSL